MSTRSTLAAVVFALGVATATLAPPARAATQTVTVRYEQADEVGVSLDNGGLFTALRRWPSVAIPAWATSATVSVVDDRGLPVSGVVDLYEASVQPWADRRLSMHHAMCSTPHSFPVPPGGSMEPRVVAGATADPHGPCAVAPSTPTTGVITIRFRG
jgi:hypothetical protein